MEPASESSDDYRSYVEHPRYGRGPRLTALHPSGVYTDGTVVTHSHSGPDDRIPNTAVAANIAMLSYAAGGGWYGSPIAYYFDVRRICRDCRRKFIFFAEEQKHWYEELRFPLEVDCVRCHECRRLQRGFERARTRYNELVVLSEPNPAELTELLSLSLDLIDGGVFFPAPHTFSRVRMWLNRLSKFPAHDETRIALTLRLTDHEKAKREEIRRLVEELQRRDPPV